MPVEYAGEREIVDMAGYYSVDGDDEDAIFVGDDMQPSDEALRRLKHRIHGAPPEPAAIQGLRKKLKLSQREAGRLFKVGEKAFDKYERGLVEPSGPTIQLLRLLDRHPELLDELR